MGVKLNTATCAWEMKLWSEARGTGVCGDEDDHDVMSADSKLKAEVLEHQPRTQTVSEV